MNLDEALVSRRSIRNFLNEKMSNEEIKEIEEKIKKLLVLDENIKIKGVIVEDGINFQKDTMKGFIGDYGKVIAPHYIVWFSEKIKGYKENLGYTFEELVLWMSTKGIGSCWIGGNFNVNDIKLKFDVEIGLEPVIIIAFGKPDIGINMYRKRKEYKRKNISDLIIKEEMNNDSLKQNKFENEWFELIDIARLAPSAVNMQPWRFEIKDEILNLYLNKGAFLSKLVAERWGKLDCGIILKHIVLIARISGYKAEIFYDSLKQSRLEYIASINKIIDNEA